jgi:hypothetical protein
MNCEKYFLNGIFRSSAGDAKPSDGSPDELETIVIHVEKAKRLAHGSKRRGLRTERPLRFDLIESGQGTRAKH